MFCHRSILLLLSLFLTACGSHVSHFVKRGETLYSIGWEYGQDFRKIAAWNNIPPPYVIHEGQMLRVAPPLEPWWEDDYGVVSSSSATKKRRDLPKKEIIAHAPTRRNTNAPIVSDMNGGKINWRWPTKGRAVRDKSHTAGRQKGLEIFGKRGQSIMAAAPGRVVYSGSGLRGYGKLIIIKHNNNYLSAYAHNDRILVSEGEAVANGQQIAEMGVKGDGDALLYFEIRRQGKPVDVLRYLAGSGR